MKHLHDLHCPIRKIKVKKTYYRTLLLCLGFTMMWVHHYIPDHEITIAVVLNTLFAIDPTA